MCFFCNRRPGFTADAMSPDNGPSFALNPGGGQPAFNATALENTVAFISGVTNTATVAATAFANWDGANPAVFHPTQSAAIKYGSLTLNVNGSAGGLVNYWFDTASNWTTVEKAAWTSSLALWQGVANVSFAEVGTVGAAHFTITRGNDKGAFHQSPNGTPATIGSGTAGSPGPGAIVSIDTSGPGFGPIGAAFTVTGGYAWGTVVHELGHLLGLGHAGAYNSTVNPATQQFSMYDTTLWSIMSYIAPYTTTAKFFNSYPVTGTSWGTSPDNFGNSPTTPMPLDYLAIQRLYGAPTTGPYMGGQTYGFNVNIAGESAKFFDFTINTTPIVTLYNAGTGNTLDLSGFAQASNISLVPGTFSSANGLVNNIGIAFNTVIETAIGGIGNDTITGSTANNVLNGGAGTDVMRGGAGNDTYNVDNAGDFVGENFGEGTDLVVSSVSYSLGANFENLTIQGAAVQAIGNELTNVITGSAIANYIDGGSGADVLIGAGGDDVYVIDNSFDQVTENASEGTDLVNASVNYVLGNNIENLTLNGTAIQGIGNTLANIVTGNATANYIDGGAGADALYGLGGDDVYVIDSSFDQIVENAAEGTDLVYAAVSFQLGANVENLQLQGAAVQGLGNALVNTITGTALANYIDGGAGADGLIGGDGHDTYAVDSSFDQIVERVAEGTDTVNSSVDYVLGQNLEYLTLTGAAVQGIGNGVVNNIVGSDGVNVLSGGGGVGDVLTGHGGNDIFLFIAGQTNGTTIMDFAGNGAAAGDSLAFQGFGAGAILTPDNAVTWRITYNGGASVEVFNLANSAAIHVSDYSFT